MSRKRPWSIAELNQMVDQGRVLERLAILEMLETYLELTFLPGDDGKTELDTEWDCGFQAAIALIRGNPRFADTKRLELQANKKEKDD